ncbi:MAG: surface polysaccharide O-acyltransferase-like enzyme [Psychromonas sp.]|jgi:surface polysaccharide O-acyltransferase-like enzyme|uniref:acyltransferase n=1 Tax=Psychromonas sp. TaxID=1884585 RepID=UPI0039E5D5D3
MKQKRPAIFYLDLLRCVASFAVVAIHVLGPFRYLYGEIPDSDWLAAMGINSATRWAVPVFIMISGALLLSSDRHFNCEHYLSKRLAKVAIPFVGWSFIYAFVGGFVAGSWSSDLTMKMIENSANEPVWYHLWFFYDFLPLYFVIPFLAPLLKKISPELSKLIVIILLLLFLMNWLKVESFLRQNLVLYTGYLILGWYLYNRDNSKELKYWLIAGVSMLLLNFFGSWQLALENGQYSSFYMGYKTLNTVLIAAMLFVLAQRYANKIRGKLRMLISVIAKYSLGIYLLHPLLLIPVRDLDNGYYAWFGSNWLAIPIIALVVMLLSLLCTILLAKVPFFKRLVP